MKYILHNYLKMIVLVLMNIVDARCATFYISDCISPKVYETK